MWLVMRGALGERAEEVYRFYHVPASSTGVGHIIIETRDFHDKRKGKAAA